MFLLFLLLGLVSLGILFFKLTTHKANRRFIYFRRIIEKKIDKNQDRRLDVIQLIECVTKS